MQHRYWSIRNGNLTLFCHVQPGARCNQLQGIHDHRLKIQLKTAPVDGKANKALIEFLAKLLDVSQAEVAIKNGTNQRKKTLIIEGLDKLPDIINFN